jgi:hypothetical protein
MKSIRGIETHCYFHENNEVRQYLIKDAISKIQDIRSSPCYKGNLDTTDGVDTVTRRSQVRVIRSTSYKCKVKLPTADFQWVQALSEPYQWKELCSSRLPFLMSS